ncbi:MAG: TAT-variant-translocated molybdopterin oxidoreductase, partial [Myxococcales bacterium]|nr:TAT-variant-translocated molybdopterin oxidoreductase [Myxococcales bacterium]
MSQEEELHVLDDQPGASEHVVHAHPDHDGHDHDHDDHDHDDEHHDETPLADLSPIPVHGYWKSLAELDGTAAWQVSRTGHEFPPEADATTKDPLSRRNFFHLMGASMALAGVGACSRYEKEEIVPLARRPEDQTPGVTQEYATAFELGGVGHALVATAFEGRPIKLDGNPEHPFASGGVVTGTERHAGCSTFAQASILHLYDPDRAQSPTNKGTGSSFEAFRAALGTLASTAGALTTTHVLSEASSSPTLRALRARLVGAGAQWHEYEPLS